jgi:predicted RNA-binding Zn-ribbon protein involved in translation (DUF1610 family)
MKLLNRFTWISIVATLALTVMPKVSAEDAPIGKGGAQLLMHARPLTHGASMKVENGDIAVSTCPMCKTTSYRRIDSAKGGAGQLGQTGKGSSCPACGAIMADSDSEAMKHACPKCGADMICSVIPSENHRGKHSDAHESEDEPK